MDNHSMPNNLFYLFAAFTVTWAVFFIYAFFVSKKKARDEPRDNHTLQRIYNIGRLQKIRIRE